MTQWIFGAMGVIALVIGLFLAALGQDVGIQLFGYALTVAGPMFVWWMIKTAFDEAEGKGDRSIEGA